MAIWCGWNSHRKPEVNSVGEDQHSSYLQSLAVNHYVKAIKQDQPEDADT